jgi:hypothetical protein
VIRRWVVALEDIPSGNLVQFGGSTATDGAYVFRSRAVSHCNWRNAKRVGAGVRWVVIDRRAR